MQTIQARIICLSIAALTGLSIMLGISGLQIPVLFPMGNFLFRQFHIAAFYVPAIFLFGATLIRFRKFSRNYIGLLWFSSLPFLTAAMMFQIMAGKNEYLAPGLVIDILGQVAGAMSFFLLLAIEVALMVKMYLFASGKDLCQHEGKIKLVVTRTLENLGLNTRSTRQSKVEENVKYTESSMPSREIPKETPWPVSVLSFIEKPEEPVSASPPEPVAPPSPSEDGDEPASSMLYNLLQSGEQAVEKDMPEGTWETAIIPEEPIAHFSEEVPTEETRLEQNPATAPTSGDPLEIVNLEDLQTTNLTDLLSDNESEWNNNTEPALPWPLPLETDQREAHPKDNKQEECEERSPRTNKPYMLPKVDRLNEYPDSDYHIIDNDTREGARILERTLREFKIEARVTGISKGPVITMYEIFPSPGVKLSSIINLQDNIALQMAASSVRIVAPIPGKHAVGIEIPNKNRTIVSFRSLMESNDFRNHDASIPVVLGKDLSGGNEIMDLTRTPHLLIAGATGSGKSVCVNTLISSILYSRKPDEVKMIMVDPKIVELKLYNGIPHLLTPVITDPKRALKALKWCLMEMERRYQLLDKQGVRSIESYNQRIKETESATTIEKLPYIVVIVDEFADLMATSGKQLEGIVARLAAMSRAVGIHLVLATQRPSVDVITGLIKANFPSRIAFMVAAKTDSRIIIDAMGADKLLGRGDMLFVSSWHPFPQRIQGAFMSEEEAERLSDYIKSQGEPQYLDEEIFMEDEDNLEDATADMEPLNEDPMYHEALEIVLNSRKASASYLQRRLKLGYNRAARLIEEMERQGVLGPANGSKPREILRQMEENLSGD